MGAPAAGRRRPDTGGDRGATRFASPVVRSPWEPTPIPGLMTTSGPHTLSNWRRFPSTLHRSPTAPTSVSSTTAATTTRAGGATPGGSGVRRHSSSARSSGVASRAAAGRVQRFARRTSITGRRARAARLLVRGRGATRRGPDAGSRPKPSGSTRQQVAASTTCCGTCGSGRRRTSRRIPASARSPTASTPKCSSGSDYKVLRGGSWATHPLAIRPTFRNWDYPIRRQIFAGFRTARDA